MTMIEDPRKMVFRRPSMLPSHIVEIAPKKQPTLYDATEMPKKSMTSVEAVFNIPHTLYRGYVYLLGIAEAYLGILRVIDLWEYFYL